MIIGENAPITMVNIVLCSVLMKPPNNQRSLVYFAFVFFFRFSKVFVLHLFTGTYCLLIAKIATEKIIILKCQPLPVTIKIPPLIIFSAILYPYWCSSSLHLIKSKTKRFYTLRHFSLVFAIQILKTILKSQTKKKHIKTNKLKIEFESTESNSQMIWS